MMDQTGIMLHHPYQFEHVVARLAQRVRHGDAAACGVQLHRVARAAAQRGALPVLHLQQQQAPARAEDHEVRLTRPRSDGDVVPDDVVVLQATLELVQHPALARVNVPIYGGHPHGQRVRHRARPVHAAIRLVVALVLGARIEVVAVAVAAARAVGARADALAVGMRKVMTGRTAARSKRLEVRRRTAVRKADTVTFGRSR